MELYEFKLKGDKRAVVDLEKIVGFWEVGNETVVTMLNRDDTFTMDMPFEEFKKRLREVAAVRNFSKPSVNQ